MDKKKFKEEAVTKIEEGVSIAFGVGTGFVTKTICMGLMPEGLSEFTQLAYRAGTYGLSCVTGSTAAVLVRDEIKDRKTKAKRFLNNHKKNKVKMEVVEE